MDNTTDDYKLIEFYYTCPSEEEYENSDVYAKSFLKDPDEWEFFNSDYDPETKNCRVSFFMGDESDLY